MTIDSTTNHSSHHQQSQHHDQTVSTTSLSSSSSPWQRFFKAKYILLVVIVSLICIFLVLGSPSMPQNGYEDNDDSSDNNAHNKSPPSLSIESNDEDGNCIVLKNQGKQKLLKQQPMKEDDDEDKTKNQNKNKNNKVEPPTPSSSVPDEDVAMGGQSSLYNRYPSLPYVDQFLTQYQETGYRYQPSGIMYRKFIPAEALNLLRTKNSDKDRFGASKNISNNNNNDNTNNNNDNNKKTQSRPPARTATVLVPADGDVTTLPALAAEDVIGTTFIQMSHMVPPGLGLSTQLMTYIHVIAAAQAARTRVLLFPEALRTSWFSLVNMSATTFPGPPVIYAANPGTIERVFNRWYLIHGSSNTKNAFEWTREEAAYNPYQIKKRLVRFFDREAMKQLAKIPSMYKKYPFAIEKEINFGKMTCGIVYHSKIEALSMRLLQNMEQQVKDYLSGAEATDDDTPDFNSFNNIKQVSNQTSSSSSTVIIPPFPWSISESSAKPYLIPPVRYVSLHLRIEQQDSIAFKRPAPRPAQLEDFLRNVVSKICLQHKTHHVFVASGPLNQSYYDVLKKTNYVVAPGIMMNVYTKEDLIEGDTVAEQMSKDHFLHEEQTEIIWQFRKIFPTNTKMAAVDSILLQHGVAAILTGFSSLTALVYSRRCYEGPRCLGGLYGTEGKYGGATNYLYEMTVETGKFTNAKPFQCGYRMGELLRGGNVKNPPKQEDYFMENPRPNLESLFDGE